MIFRIIIILVCVLFFINGCSSLISSIAGTQKLRTYSLEEVRKSGLGDADYVEITGAWSSGEYIFEPHRNASWPGFVQWPVLDKSQFDSLEQGRNVTVSMYAWTKSYEEGCVENGDCVTRGPVTLKGLIRPLNRKFNRMAAFSEKRYTMADHPVFIEYNEKPLAWYWNLTLMAAAASLIILVERWRVNKEKKAADTAS